MKTTLRARCTDLLALMAIIVLITQGCSYLGGTIFADSVANSDLMACSDLNPCLDHAFADMQRLIAIAFLNPLLVSARAENDSIYKYERGRTRFVSSETVTGNGFTNIRRQMESPDKDCLSLQEHGSGAYASNTSTEYFAVNTSITPEDGYDVLEVFPEYAEDLFDDFLDYNYMTIKDDNLSLSYRPTSLPLPRLRSLNFSTRWSMTTRALSRESEIYLLDSYRYASGINRSANLVVDQSDVDAEFAGDFQGAADIRHKTPTSNSRNRYAGSFQLQEDISAGESTSSASGTGFVDIDKAIKSEGLLRSYEHGSGRFALEEYTNPGRSRLDKNISLRYEPAEFDLGSGRLINQSRKWSEGVITCSADIGQTSEEFTNLERLDKDTRVSDLAAVETDASFTGSGQFSAAEAGENFTDVEEYTGNYSLRRSVSILKYPRYGRPHVSVTKQASYPIDCRFISYNITVLNDGNTALGPVYVRDTFPVGSVFLATTHEPLELTYRYINWSIEELASGESKSIQLRLRIERDVEKLTNRVRATAYYVDKSNRELRTYSDFTTSDPLDLGSCVPPELMLTMRADKNTTYPHIINCQLTLDNKADCNLSVNLTALIPAGAEFLDAPQKPKLVGKDNVTWTYKLNSGKKRTMRYRLNIPESGLVETKGRAYAVSVDGQRHFTAEASAYVSIPKSTAGYVTRIRDDWLPGDLYDIPAMPAGSCSSGSCPLLWEPGEAANLYPPIRLVQANPGYTRELPCC